MSNSVSNTTNATRATGQVPSHVNSYWNATACPSPSIGPLLKDAVADVVIIGAGFTGLSAAWHLQRAGISSIVLEANDVAWGASGRNGGMLPPRYKKGFATLASRYGNEVTRRLHRLALEAVDTVEEIVAEAGFECDFRRTGQITAALGPNHLAGLREDAEWAAAEAGDRAPRILNSAEVLAEVGGGRYVGAWFDPRGAGVHPLSYSRGLAAALLARGVAIHGATPVLSLQGDAKGVVAATPGGTVRATQAIVATNAYTDLFARPPGHLDRRIVPVTSSLIATRPLDPAVAKTIIPGRQMVVDSRHLMFYYRMQSDGTLLFGGRGDITGRRDDPSVYAGLEQGLAETFPQIAGAPIAYRWSGKVAVTLDDLPHIGRVTPRVAYAMGYGGRGVALSNLLGRFLADVVRGIPIDVGPMSSDSFTPIPFHAFRVPGMKIVAGWYRLKDARESRAVEQKSIKGE
jgi:gamma-glutamylputrescine oxidase